MPNVLRLRSLRTGRGFRNFLLRRFPQGGETRRVAHSHISENFPVELDSAYLQAVNQLAVGDAVVTRCCADALNPQRAVVALARAPVAIAVTQRAIHRFLR